MEKKNRFVKAFLQAQVRFKRKLKQSIVDFTYTNSENDLITVSYPHDSTGALFGDVELKRCACESQFYKYVMNVGSDFGPLGSEPQGILRSLFPPSQPVPRRGIDFMLIEDGKVWKGFDKECRKLRRNGRAYVGKMLTYRADGLNESDVRFLKRKYLHDATKKRAS